MTFRFIDAAKESFPVQRLCQVLGVSQSGYFAWPSCPASLRQQEDLVLLAHIRSCFARSHGTYGSPRMTRERQFKLSNDPKFVEKLRDVVELQGLSFAKHFDQGDLNRCSNQLDAIGEDML